MADGGTSRGSVAADGARARSGRAARHSARRRRDRPRRFAGALSPYIIRDDLARVRPLTDQNEPHHPPQYLLKLGYHSCSKIYTLHELLKYTLNKTTKVK